VLWLKCLSKLAKSFVDTSNLLRDLKYFLFERPNVLETCE